MPRRRSHGLTSASFPTFAAFNATAAGLTVVLVVAGCTTGPTDNGCQIQKQVVLPGTTPLPLLPHVSIERIGTTTIVLGSDGTSVRWTAITGKVAGDEQSLALPADTLRAFPVLAGVDAPGDHVIVGVLVPAANGADAELRLVSAPADGSPAGAPGDPIATFADGATTPPEVAMGTSASGSYAGVAWIDDETQLPMYAFVDGHAQLVGAPTAVETTPAPGYSCLGFGRGKDELTISYQRSAPDPLLVPTWMIADVTVEGAISTLALSVSQPGGTMGCARAALYDNDGTPEYAIVWQDPSGSWLSVYYGPQLGTVKSFPFASATDFGGPDLQPPVSGFAAFGKDFGVLFAKAHSVEVWRMDRLGNRRDGTLVLPSLEGNVGDAASVTSADLLTATYADYTAPGEGRRLVIDAVCY